MCGENGHLKPCQLTRLGSPPRVRGKQIQISCSRYGYGITPACAGKTRQRLCRLPSGKDHPRVCGENVVGIGLNLVEIGSPPRVRGKLPLPVSTFVNVRITPACAGKTFITLRLI